MADEEYDLTLRQLIDLENKYPELITPDSPTQRVGGTASTKLNKFQHKTKMMSLANAFSADELRKFDNDIKKAVGNDKVIEYCDVYVYYSVESWNTACMVYEHTKMAV